MKKLRRSLTFLTAFVLLLAVAVSAFDLESFKDYKESHWANVALSHSIDNGLIYGYEDNTLRPDRDMTRAEMATIINRAFGAEVKADVSKFVDLKESDWYYTEMQKAVQMQTFGGVENRMEADRPIYRQEAMAVIARAMVLPDADPALLDKFVDANKVSDWAKPLVAALVKRGYVNGNEKKEVQPLDYITRAEFAQMMYNIFSDYIQESGTHSVNSERSLMINVPNVTLQNCTVNGDLVLGDGVGRGFANITNVTVKGRILIRGGDKVTLKNVTTAEGIVVKNVNGTVNFQNYADEPVFKGILPYTHVTYLQRTPVTPGPSGPSGPVGPIVVYYTVTFYNGDNTVMKTQYLTSGQSATAPTDTPTPPANTAEWTYGAFIGWDKEFTNIKSNLNVFPKFEMTKNSYLVKFLDWDGSELKSESVEYGTIPTPPADPTRASTAESDYVFAGWGTVSAVTGEATYTANYTETPRKYTIFWKNEDGTPLETDFDVPYGTAHTFNGTTPTKASTVQYEYTFLEWIPVTDTVNATVTYTASYTETIRKYEIKFLDWDGFELKSEEVEYGTLPTAPADPTRAQDEVYRYEFAGWGTVSTVTGEATYTATYNPILREYPVTLIYGEGVTGVTITEITVNYNQLLTDKLPTSGFTKENYYFAGWYNGTELIDTETYADLNGVTSLTAKWVDEFTVNFLNADGTVFDTQTVKYGENATVPLGEPALPADDAEWDYISFDKWDIDFSVAITSNLDIRPIFNRNKKSYTITFKDWDGFVLKSVTLDYGTMPTAPADPTRASTAKYDYTFKEWTPEVSVVNGEATYTATYNEILRSYTILWKNADGTILETDSTLYGTLPEYNGNEPVKEQDNEYRYEFAGWDITIEEVTGEATYTATYNPILREYPVTLNYGEDVENITVTEIKVNYNQLLTDKLPTSGFTKENFYFAGWYNGTELIDTETYADLGGVTELTAKWVEEFTVNFLNADGSIFDTQTVKYGEKATIPLGEPTVPADDAEWDYISFDKWDIDFNEEITSNLDIKPIFNKVKQTYLIEFLDWNDSVIDSDYIEYGEMPTVPADPTRESTAQYHFEFKGWDKTIEKVTQKATYKAEYNEILRSYTVTWISEGQTLEVDRDVPYGTKPNYDGTTPTKESTVQYDYSFASWSPDVDDVKGDITYTATFTETPRIYKVEFVNWNGAVLQSENLAYGTTPIPPANPTRQSTTEYDYTFDKWSPEIDVVTGAKTYTATYTKTLRKYVIQFVNYDDSVLQSTEVEYGSKPVYFSAEPQKPSTAQYYYEFKSWDKAIEEVTGEATYKAVYEEKLQYYFIDWVDEDGTVLETDYLAYGETPRFNNYPITKESTVQYDYTFAGWSPAVTQVTGNATYTVTYTETLRKYIVDFVDYDRTVLQSESLEYGTIPTPPADPTREKDNEYEYEFDGWDKTISAVSGRTTYTATYKKTPIEYTVYLDYGEDVENITVTEIKVYYYEQLITKLPMSGFTKENYYFAGWYLGEELIDSESYADLNGNTTLTAKWSDEFTVRFLNADGTVFNEQIVKYGESATRPLGTPAVPADDAEWDYIDFYDWDKDFSNVTSNLDVRPIFNKVKQKYTVQFLDWDNTVLKSTSVEYGATPTAPASPTRESTAQYDYIFQGWTPQIDVVTGEATYKAVYFSELRKYTITWKNYDGTVIETDERIPYGTLPEYNGSTPVKPQDDEYRYEFADWDTAVSEVTGEKTYTATYNPILREYPVTLIYGDGVTGITVTDILVYFKGILKNELPYDNFYKEGYYFAGWYNGTELIDTETYADLNGVTSLTAKWVKEFTVRFLDADGNEISKQTVLYGESATAPADPAVPADTAEWDYISFDKWDTDFTNVTSNLDIRPIFNRNKKSYTVKFVDYNGSEFTSESVEYGEMPTIPADPTRVADAQYTYEFAGWTPEVDVVTGEATYKATYTSTLRTYTVIWKNGEDTLETDKNVPYGTMPTYDGETPTKAATAQYTYTFDKWTPEVDVVTGDITYTATFNEVVNTYTVLWKNYNGGVLQADFDVPYGTTPVYKETPPTKPEDNDYVYNFIGWLPKVSTIEGDTVYVAQYEAISKTGKYTVTWVNRDGTVLEKDENVPFGTMPEYNGETPTLPATEDCTYEFIGWTPLVSTVRGDITYTANYREIRNTYIITWVDYDGTELHSEEVSHGVVPTPPANPTRPSSDTIEYTFAGWTPTIVAATGNATYTATYTETPIYYTVTFVYDNGTADKVVTDIQYGNTITLETDITKDKYFFMGWKVDGEETVITTDAFTFNYKKDITLTAQWSDVYFTVQHFFPDGNGGYVQNTAEYPDEKWGANVGDVVYARDYAKEHIENFVFDDSVSDGSYGQVTSDNSLVIKVHYQRTYTVTFYSFNRTTGTFDEIKAVKGLKSNSKLLETDFPTGNAQIKTGYETGKEEKSGGRVVNHTHEDANDIYDSHYEHEIYNTWSYMNGSERVEFTTDTVITGDTDVYATFKRLVADISTEKFGDLNGLAVNYDTSRIADTVKDILYGNENLILNFLNQTDLQTKLYEKLAEKKIIDEDGNILNQEFRVKIVDLIGDSNLDKFIKDNAKANVIHVSDDELTVAINEYLIGDAHHSEVTALLIDLFENDKADTETVFKPALRDIINHNKFFFTQILNANKHLIPAEYSHLTVQEIADELYKPENSSALQDLIKTMVDHMFLEENWDELESTVAEMMEEIKSDPNIRRETIELIVDMTHSDAVQDMVVEEVYTKTLDEFARQLRQEESFTIHDDFTYLIATAMHKKYVNLTVEGLIDEIGLPNAVKGLLNKNEVVSKVINDIFVRSRDIFVNDVALAMTDWETSKTSSEVISYIPIGFDPIDDIVVPLYPEAIRIFEAKAANRLHLDKNKYARELLDFITPDNLLVKTGVESDILSGYAIPEAAELYKIMYTAAVLADDAAKWYVDNLDKDKIDALINRAEDTVLIHINAFIEIANEYNKNGTIPKVDDLPDGKLKTLLENYNVQSLLDNERTKVFIEKLINNGTFNTVIEKFCTSPLNREYTSEDYAKAVELFNLIYENYNNEEFTVDQLFDNAKISEKLARFRVDEDTYKIEFRGNSITVKRILYVDGLN